MVDPSSATAPSGVLSPEAKYCAVTNTASEDRHTSVGGDERGDPSFVSDKPAALAWLRIASRACGTEPSAITETILEAPSGPDRCASWVTSPREPGLTASTTASSLSVPPEHPAVTASVVRLNTMMVKRMWCEHRLPASVLPYGSRAEPRPCAPTNHPRSGTLLVALGTGARNDVGNGKGCTNAVDLAANERYPHRQASSTERTELVALYHFHPSLPSYPPKKPKG